MYLSGVRSIGDRPGQNERGMVMKKANKVVLPSMKSILARVDEMRVVDRVTAQEVLERVGEVTTDRLVNLICKADWEVKRNFWNVLKTRSDLTIKQLRGIELLLKRDMRNFRNIVEEIEGLVYVKSSRVTKDEVVAA